MTAHDRTKSTSKVMRLAGNLWTKIKDSVDEVSIRNKACIMYYKDIVLETRT